MRVCPNTHVCHLMKKHLNHETEQNTMNVCACVIVSNNFSLKNALCAHIQ